MNGLPYYRAYPRDFLEGTIGMPFELKGAYRLVLDLIYMQGGELPDDQKYISGLLGCSVRAWNKYRSELIGLGKIRVDNGVISNFRADKELESLSSFQDKQRQNRSRPNKNNDLSNTTVSPKANHTEPDTYKEREANASPKKSASKKRTRLSGEWRLPSDWRAYAVEKGIPSSAIDREAEKFRDHHLSHGNTMADWKAAWRTWVGNFGKFGSPRLIGPSSQDEFGAFGKLKDLTNGR